MQSIHANFELINYQHAGLVYRKLMEIGDIKRLSVDVLVDTNRYMCTINEDIREMLDLLIIESRQFKMSDGEIVLFDMAGPIELRFGSRVSIANAIVLPGSSEPVLGILQVSAMGLMVDPVKQELICIPIALTMR